MNSYYVAIIIGIDTINGMGGNEISFYSRVTNKLTLTLTHKVFCMQNVVNSLLLVLRSLMIGFIAIRN